MSNKYQIICADCPWAFSDKLKMDDVKRGAEANYNTMTISQIKALPVNSIADSDGALLALWVPSSILQDGLDVMSAWGFTHKQTYIWVKTKKFPLSSLWKQFKKIKLSEHSAKSYLKEVSNLVKADDLNGTLAFGLGRLFRQTHEICLIGINNNGIYKKLSNKAQRSVSFGFNLKHSAKPEHLQNSLEIMFPGSKKLEMFARRHRNDWTCIGNEVCNGEDITVSLAKLL
jgi:N6-adenosine-specific RNA methylase IME4